MATDDDEGADEDDDEDADDDDDEWHRIMFMPMMMTMMMMIISMTFSGHCHDYAFRNRYRCHGLLPHLVNICTRALADGHTVVAALLERPHLWPLLGWMPHRGAAGGSDRCPSLPHRSCMASGKQHDLLGCLPTLSRNGDGLRPMTDADDDDDDVFQCCVHLRGRRPVLMHAAI